VVFVENVGDTPSSDEVPVMGMERRA